MFSFFLFFVFLNTRSTIESLGPRPIVVILCHKSGNGFNLIT